MAGQGSTGNMDWVLKSLRECNSPQLQEVIAKFVGKCDPIQDLILSQHGHFDRNRQTPWRDGVEEFDVRSRDGLTIKGWLWRNPHHQKGTLFYLHGFTRNCGDGSEFFSHAQSLGTHLVSFDFRSHGQSENRINTFGTAEMWDFQSVMTHAESVGLPGLLHLILGEPL